MARTCPSCASDLHTVAAGPVTLDGCDSCGGIWFDAGEPQRIAEQGAMRMAAIDRSFKPSRAPSVGVPKQCPACAQPLQRSPIPGSGVEADRCARCGGLWLEHGALTRIAQHLRREAVASPLTEPAVTGPCPFCGAAVSPGARYCSLCISSLTGPVEPLPPVKIEPYAARPILWIASAPVVLLVLYLVLRLFDATWFLYLVGPAIIAACIVGAFHEWAEGGYMREASEFARHRRFSFGSNLTASDLVERFRNIGILLELSLPEQAGLQLSGGGQGTYRNQYVMERTTRTEMIAAFTLSHVVGTGRNFYYGQKPAAVIECQEWQFPATIIRPRLLARAAASVEAWIGLESSVDSEAFKRQFSVQGDDPAFARRLLTPKLKRQMLEAGSYALELRGPTVAAATLSERAPGVIAAPLAGYVAALTLARAASEAAKTALAADEERGHIPWEP